MGRVAPSVIPATGTQPALTKGEVMVGGQVGTRSLGLPMSQKLGEQLLKCFIRESPTYNYLTKKKKKLNCEQISVEFFFRNLKRFSVICVDP